MNNFPDRKDRANRTGPCTGGRVRPEKMILIILIVIYPGLLIAQSTFSISGIIQSKEDRTPVEGATVVILPGSLGTITDKYGYYQLEGIEPGNYTLSASFIGRQTEIRPVSISNDDLKVDFILTVVDQVLDGVTITGKNENIYGISRLRQVEKMAIYASKKHELVILDQITANKAANTSRQIYAKVSGLNIWESDGAGVQLGIGGRGLSPNRNANFNTRQNGYDISADALGYPESYYTPPVEAISRIEVIRGAASLQYGTQFGGMLNFVFNEGHPDKPVNILSRHSIGSFGFYSTFNSIGGTTGKLNYYSFYQYKKSNGWRPNSQLDQHTAFLSGNWQVSHRLRIRPEYTFTQYLAQQPGGLTDAQFNENPRRSFRSRNWFQVNWNLLALSLDYQINDRVQLNSRTFGLLASRDALGNLSDIQLQDFGENRDLLHDQFRNAGNETRLIWRYQTRQIPSTFLTGFRIYRGRTHRQQGEANDDSGADFEYLTPEYLQGSDFILPSLNYAWFAENLLNINEKWSITPGVRWEWIRTETDGYYRETTKDLAGNLLSDLRIDEAEVKTRSFLLFGLGSSFKPNGNLEIYTNFSQNYRAINFNDIRVSIGNLVVDENLKDERGFNLDLGVRGSVRKILEFDASVYLLYYQDRIGTILKKEPNPVFNNLTDRIIRFRTNIADARIYGIESLIQWHLIGNAQQLKNQVHLSLFGNASWTRARYHTPEVPQLNDNQVELVPPVTLKVGVEGAWKNLGFSLLFSHTARHFSDASNAISTPSAIEGLIPSYQVTDLSTSYHWSRYEIETGINNLLNVRYFTRRATGYPGPGIIPSDGRNFYLTVGVKI